MKNINSILKDEYNFIAPAKPELEIIRAEIKKIIEQLNKNIKKKKIKASVFIGGSFAKNTLIKKDKYDIDIFIRFNSSLSEEQISKAIGQVVPSQAKRVHGSRDYFVLKTKNQQINLEFEIIPVVSIKKPTQARNITDLSYFHVTYVNKKIKAKPNLAREIMLAKAFIHYQDCYGAESYIHGFSGYAVELLIISYGGLFGFLKSLVKSNFLIDKKKIILDPEKFYKNKEEILMSLNESKLQSPIILIDPTFKERNALAGLGDETFFKLQDSAKRFLKNPSLDFFKLKDKTKRFDKYSNVIKINVKTNRQPGDIAGTKLKKFYGFLIKNSARYFDIKDSEFFYNDSSSQAEILIVAEPKKEILFRGPPINMIEPLNKFKKEHKNVVIKDGMAYSSEKGYSNFQEFLNELKKDRIVKSMGITEIKL